LITVLYEHCDYDILKEAVVQFKKELFSLGKIYCFADIPSEDILLIKSLGNSGFRTIETRLTYYMENLKQYNHERYSVREATIKDNESLKRVAREIRNDYDRFHANEIFNTEQANEFIRCKYDT
jgi:dTDP-4-amino-4,6-dideoxy-D-galactose acyltransferase